MSGLAFVVSSPAVVMRGLAFVVSSSAFVVSGLAPRWVAKPPHY